MCEARENQTCHHLIAEQPHHVADIPNKVSDAVGRQNRNIYNSRSKEDKWKGQWWGKERKGVATIIDQQTFKNQHAITRCAESELT